MQLVPLWSFAPLLVVPLPAGTLLFIHKITFYWRHGRC
jgi:hypothetical protein